MQDNRSSTRPRFDDFPDSRAAWVLAGLLLLGCGGGQNGKPPGSTPAARSAASAQPAGSSTAEPRLTEKLDQKHREFKEAIHEPAEAVDQAARTVVDRGKELVGADQEQSAPKNSTARTASATASKRSRSRSRHSS